MTPCESPPLAINEQKILHRGISTDAQPCSQHLRSLCAEKSDAILPSFAAPNVQGAGREIHVFDAQPKRLGDPSVANAIENAIRQFLVP
jgi:hypothetical protein